MTGVLGSKLQVQRPGQQDQQPLAQLAEVVPAVFPGRNLCRHSLDSYYLADLSLSTDLGRDFIWDFCM